MRTAKQLQNLVSLRVVVALLFAGTLAFASVHPAHAAPPPTPFTITNLGTLPGGTASRALAINNKGQIVGGSITGGGVGQAFLWYKSVMQDLGTLPGDTFSAAQGINDKGQIVGYSATGSIGFHAVLWSPSSS